MISVCMATYNGEKYIKEQIISILVQLSENDELIISDDHSTDDTIKIAKSFQDQRIKIYFNEKEKGYVKNFEYALEKSLGDIIFLSDQDDVWIKNKVHLCLRELENNDFVVHDAMVVDKDLKLKYESIFKFRKAKNGFWINFVNIKYLGCCMAFKRKVLNTSLPFPPNQFLVTQDSWLTLVAEMFFKVSLIQKPLIMYRRHEQNTSAGGAKGTNTLLKKIHIRLYSMYFLIKIFFTRKYK